MKLHQLSLFLENRAGQLEHPCMLLANAGINILTLSLADTQQFGIMRLIVSDWQKAKQVLQDAGCVVNVTEVLAVEVEDRPGGLADVLRVIEEHKINVEYMYASPSHRLDRAVLIFRFEDTERAQHLLPAQGVKLVEEADLLAHS